jgi:hypothetical protein
VRAWGLLSSPKLLFGAILVLAVALRLYGITTYPFEEDELYSIVESTQLFNSPLHPGIEARPLYYFLQHALLAVAPATHLGMRVMPLVFGVLGVIVTWVLGRTVFGTTGAVVAAFLVAVSPWHIHVSGMARYGSLLYLLSALFLLLLIRAEDSDRPAYYAGCLAALLLGSATHPSFLFPVLGVVLGSRLIRSDGRWGWVWPTRRAWIYLWLPFLSCMAGAVVTLKLLGREGEVRNFAGRGLLASVRLIPAIVEWITPVIFVAGALGALLALLVGTLPRTRRWGAAACVGSLGTLVILLTASFVTNVYADYAVTMLPLVFVSAAGLITLLSERVRSEQPVFASAIGLLLLAGVLPSLASQLSDGMRFDFRPAFRYIRETAPSVPVLTTPLIQQRHYAPDLDGRELQMTRAFLDESLAHAGDLWIAAPVRRHGILMDDSGEAAAWIDRHCLLALSHERARFDYRVYRVDLYRCTADSSGAASPAVGGNPPP